MRIRLEIDDGDDEFNMCQCINTNRTYYVAQTGNDTNSGLTSGAAFGTIEHAMDVIGGFIVPANVTVTVQLLDGTIEIASTVIPPSIDGSIVIQGNVTTPANVIVSLDGTTLGFNGKNFAKFTIKDFAISSVAGGAEAIRAESMSIIHFGNLRFGANFANIITIQGVATVIADSNFFIGAGASQFMSLVGQGEFSCIGRTITFSGLPAFSVRFTTVSGGYARYDGIVVAGSGATGVRYLVDQNGVLFTNGGGAAFLPGNSAGSAATGGQYI